MGYWTDSGNNNMVLNIRYCENKKRLLNFAIFILKNCFSNFSIFKPLSRFVRGLMRKFKWIRFRPQG